MTSAVDIFTAPRFDFASGVRFDFAPGTTLKFIEEAASATLQYQMLTIAPRFPG